MVRGDRAALRGCAAEPAVRPGDIRCGSHGERLQAAPAFPGNSSQWHWRTAAVNAFAAAVSAPLMSMAQGALRPMTMWWTAGSELVEPCVLLNRALPRPDSFAALLAGTWNDGRWDGEVAPALDSSAPSLEPDVQYVIE